MSKLIIATALAATLISLGLLFQPEAQIVGVTDTDLVKDGEGLRLCTYLDTMGIKTTCYGYNL